MRGEMWAGREGVGRRRRKRHARGEGPTQGWVPQGTREAHGEHGVHVRDAGRVEAQRLVEGRRPEPKKTALIGDRVCISTDNIWEGVGWRQRKRHARGEDPTQGWGAHREHAAHVRDVGRVEAQRLVECPRVLSGRKEGMHGEVSTQCWGPKARAERTANMLLMSVTPEVSQLDMSALKFSKRWKRYLMSETAVTCQSAIGPYVAMAAVGLAS